ncbi:hypothetical protein ACFSUD_19230 [Sulfitobacter aestuarii]|uniref:Uncharacterized protein n=1 Tax=Sulfitobacter aestuarii TaxID=2161676 RepID=A0ABW5U6Z4_9RHOB
MINTLLRGDFGAEVNLDYRPDGPPCEIHFGFSEDQRDEELAIFSRT